jgi:hypothetical protein
MLLSGSAHTFEIPKIWSVALISSSMREAASVIKKELYQEEASCESIATTESVALHWRNDSDASEDDECGQKDGEGGCGL